MIRFFNLLLLLLIFGQLNAQKYLYRADIDTVKMSGFYKIYLKPQISSKLQQNFPDIRIIDQDNNEIPFIYGSEYRDEQNFEKNELHIIRNKHRIFKRITDFIVEVDSLENIAGFILEVSNKSIKNKLKIAGSFDEKQWYEIKKRFSLQLIYTDSATTELHITNIPTTSFKYYRFIFSDYKNEVVEIQKAYSIKSSEKEKKYFALPKPVLVHKDTLEKTLIDIIFDDTYFIDKISFTIHGSEYYFRKAKIFKARDKVRHNGGVLYFDDVKKEFFLGSDRNNSIILPRFKSSHLKMEISNKDNLPIRIVDVMAFQQKNYIITYLRADMFYQLKFGSSKADFPVYDLTYFKENIPYQIPELKTLNIRQVHKADQPIIKKKIWSIKPVYLWIAVTLIGLVLILLTARLFIDKYKKGDFDD